MIGKTELVIEIEAEPPSSDKPATITYTPVIEEHIATPGETGSPSKANAHNGEVRYVMIVFLSLDDREEHVMTVFLSLDLTCLREEHLMRVFISLDSMVEYVVIVVFLSFESMLEHVMIVFLSLDEREENVMTVFRSLDLREEEHVMRVSYPLIAW